MSDRYIVPESMLRAAKESVDVVLRDAVENHSYTQDDVWNAELLGAIGWLSGILHERNVDFHQAILKRSHERYPHEPAQMVAFEFGASFARHYIRSLFTLPDGEFMECDACRMKPGSPALCKGCLHNRNLIYALRKKAAQ